MSSLLHDYDSNAKANHIEYNQGKGGINLVRSDLKNAI